MLWILLYLFSNITGVEPALPPDNAYALKTHEKICQELGKKSFFDPELVIGKPWRIYFMWHHRSDPTACVDMIFKPVTPWTIDRFKSDMYQYLETQPQWEAAMMFLKMSFHNNQLLLLSDYPLGRVIAIPNIRRNPNRMRFAKSVAFLSFQLKLLRGGKYLAMMDCRTGVTSFAARAGDTPFRAEMAAAAAELGLGEGRPTCVMEHEMTNQ